MSYCHTPGMTYNIVMVTYTSLYASAGLHESFKLFLHEIRLDYKQLLHLNINIVKAFLKIKLQMEYIDKQYYSQYSPFIFLLEEYVIKKYID